MVLALFVKVRIVFKIYLFLKHQLLLQSSHVDSAWLREELFILGHVFFCLEVHGSKHLNLRLICFLGQHIQVILFVISLFFIRSLWVIVKCLSISLLPLDRAYLVELLNILLIKDNSFGLFIFFFWFSIENTWSFCLWRRSSCTSLLEKISNRYHSWCLNRCALKINLISVW